jgi:hypothetical protein
MQSAGNLKWSQDKENEGNKGSGDWLQQYLPHFYVSTIVLKE